MSENGQQVRTVLGDIHADALGVCNAHDHLFLRSPQLPGQELDDYAAAAAEASAFVDAGGAAMVQWTPAGMGRRPGDLCRLSKETGLRIVAATGLHQARHYTLPAATPGPLAWPGNLDVDALAELFTRELQNGIIIDEDGNPESTASPRAGVIKVASGYRRLDSHERDACAAAAAAHCATGAPICVHLEMGTHGRPVLELLERHGVAAHRVVLGHLGRNPDVREHADLADGGAFLAYDAPSKAYHSTDWRLHDLIGGMVELGYGDRLLLGGDTTTVTARGASGGAPGMPSLLTTTAARLVRYLGRELTHQILVDNPARAYAWVAPEPRGE